MLIRWPTLGTEVRCRLLKEKAPKLCSAFEQILPFHSIQEHTMISGEGLYCAAPLRITFAEHLVPRAPGDVYFFNPGQLLVVVYGRTTEPIWVNKFGEVVESDLGKLTEVGRLVWSNTLAPVERRQTIPVLFTK